MLQMTLQEKKKHWYNVYQILSWFYGNSNMFVIRAITLSCNYMILSRIWPNFQFEVKSSLK